jgi:hypothetical protein
VATQSAPLFDREGASELATLVYEVIAKPDRRHDFRSDPEATAKQLNVDPDNPRNKTLILTLAALSDEEMRLLTELNETLIKEGLYVETGNPPLMVF